MPSSSGNLPRPSGTFESFDTNANLSDKWSTPKPETTTKLGGSYPTAQNFGQQKPGGPQSGEGINIGGRIPQEFGGGGKPESMISLPTSKSDSISSVRICYTLPVHSGPITFNVSPGGSVEISSGPAQTETSAVTNCPNNGTAFAWLRFYKISHEVHISVSSHNLCYKRSIIWIRVDTLALRRLLRITAGQVLSDAPLKSSFRRSVSRSFFWVNYHFIGMRGTLTKTFISS